MKLKVSFKHTIKVIILSLLLFLNSCKQNKSTVSINARPQEFILSNTDSATYNFKLIEDKFYSFPVNNKDTQLNFAFEFIKKQE